MTAKGGDGPPLGRLGRPTHQGAGEDIRVLGVEELTISCKLTELDGDLLRAPLLFEISFVQSGRRKSFDTAHDKEVLEITARQPVTVDLEHVGVEGELVDTDQLLQISIDG